MQRVRRRAARKKEVTVCFLENVLFGSPQKMTGDEDGVTLLRGGRLAYGCYDVARDAELSETPTAEADGSSSDSAPSAKGEPKLGGIFKPGKQPLRGPGKRIVVQPRRFCGAADVKSKAVKKKKKAKRTGREQKPSVSRAGQRLKQAFHEQPYPFRPTSGLATASPSFSDASDACACVP